jgi:hypothetical protein
MRVAARSSQSTAQVALFALAVMFSAACKDKDTNTNAGERLGTPQAFQMPDTTGMSAAQQAILLEAASDYDTFEERQPVAITDPTFSGPHTPGDAALNMTIATMRLKSGHAQPPQRLIARITSDADYPAMGIYSGMNFIRRSSWNTADTTSWVTKVVPTKPSAPEYMLKRDTVELTHGAASEPRLVKITVASFAFAACLDDPRCGSGHCGYW